MGKNVLRDIAEMPQFAQSFLQMMGALAEHDAEDDVIRRTFGVRIKAETIDIENRSAEFVFSTSALDSYDEIVEQDWDLTRYEANPVVLYGHNRPAGWFSELRPADTVPIGRAEDVRVEDGKLIGRIFFATEKANPFAEQIWNSVLEKTLRAVSVGFRSHNIRAEIHDDVEVYVLSSNELYETSVVPLPANAESVIRSADGANASGIREHHKAQVQRLIERQARLTAKGANASPPAPRGQEPTAMETTMDLKELQSKCDALEAENKALQATVNASQKSVTEAEAAQKQLTEERDALQQKLSEAEASLKTVSDERDKAVKVRDEQKAKVAKLDGEIAQRDVEQYLGVKFTPAEKADMLEDRVRLGTEKFAERMSKRADLVHGKDVTGTEDNTTNDTATGASASERVANKARERAEARS